MLEIAWEWRMVRMLVDAPHEAQTWRCCGCGGPLGALWSLNTERGASVQAACSEACMIRLNEGGKASCYSGRPSAEHVPQIESMRTLAEKLRIEVPA